MFTPRDYQSDAYAACGRILNEGGHPLGILATGTGKTEIAGMLATRMVKARRPVLFLAHRGFLLDQAEEKLKKHTGILPSREQGKIYADPKSLMVTGSVQSLQGDRLLRFPRDYFKYIITDECHRSTAKTYQNIYEYFVNAQRIGITATADRPDGKSLTPTYSEIAIQYSLSKAIRDGHLCRIIGRKVTNFTIDMSDVKVAGNDYTDDQVAEIIEQYLTPIAHNVERETKDRNKILLFMPDVESSKLLAQTMQEMGMKADYVSGDRNDNEEVLARFRSGEIKFLASCMLLVEGYDEPAIDCVVMLRPTLSRIIYSQAVGRGTRKHHNKDNLLLLEFTYNSNKHKLVTAYELVGGSVSDRVIEAAEAKQTQDVDFMEAISEEFRDHFSIKNIVAHACRSDYAFQSFNPFDIGDMVGAELDSGTSAWFEGRELKGHSTPGQAELLARYMIDASQMSKAQASTLIDQLTGKGFMPMKGYASSRQMSYLKSLYPGQQFPEGMTKAAVSMMIGATKEGVQKEWTD